MMRARKGDGQKEQAGEGEDEEDDDDMPWMSYFGDTEKAFELCFNILLGKVRVSIAVQ